MKSGRHLKVVSLASELDKHNKDIKKQANSNTQYTQVSYIYKSRFMWVFQGYLKNDTMCAHQK